MGSIETSTAFFGVPAGTAGVAPATLTARAAHAPATVAAVVWRNLRRVVRCMCILVWKETTWGDLV